ncbi:MAG: Endoribonuclease YbeY [Firmicutes bacterium ADurb.Bin182]|nr:MAG: Endoribonuclease YbeY [Firmicutes bacterium ADurb.Bin182]
MIELIDEKRLLSKESRDAVLTAARAALTYVKRSGDINIAIVSDERMRKMNRDFRDVDSVTDVLSFPAWEGHPSAVFAYGFLGDIAINRDAVFRQAEEYGHSAERELCFLAVHGTLHLLGFDHSDAEEEAEMFKKQKEILDWIGMKR